MPIAGAAFALMATLGADLSGCLFAPDPSANLPPVAPATVSFSKDVQPLFDAYCIRCHVVGGFANQSGIPLKLIEGVSYGLLVNQPSIQNPELLLVKPGDSAASLLCLKISSSEPPVGRQMPWDRDRGGEAPTAEEVEVIRTWIDEGARDN